VGRHVTGKNARVPHLLEEFDRSAFRKGDELSGRTTPPGSKIGAGGGVELVEAVGWSAREKRSIEDREIGLPY
jgi:hypothetical protein